ncbi:MAG: nucleotidyltransferase domain-containing protein [Acidimicrobiia bacterium]
MARDWDSWLQTASGPASATEEQERDRTERRIREAITAANDLPSSVRVYAKGSYANNTNVRRDADVDIAVEWNNTIRVRTWSATEGMTPEQLGYTPASEPVTPQDFRRRVEQALKNGFGSTAVDAKPDKCIGVAADSTTLDADVVPCLHSIDMMRRIVLFEDIASSQRVVGSSITTHSRTTTTA